MITAKISHKNLLKNKIKEDEKQKLIMIKQKEQLMLLSRTNIICHLTDLVLMSMPGFWCSEIGDRAYNCSCARIYLNFLKKTDIKPPSEPPSSEGALLFTESKGQTLKVTLVKPVIYQSLNY